VTAAVEVDGVSKRFRLSSERYTSLKERAVHFGRTSHEDFWALDDVDLEVEEGETVGLLGHNGSGKSTLLKCMAGILLPTSGEIRIRGRVTALLELGAGFHPDLSGRENVYLNASLLGLSRKSVEAKFDDIVGFAELEQHIDQQVKYYSSGMYVRLGFAVAINMDPDVLLIDEVLAVGDELFQRKCLDRIRQFQREGRTIVFVTHGPEVARQICNRVAVLHEGKLVAWGEPAEAVRSYREHLLRRRAYTEESAQIVAAMGESEGYSESGGPKSDNRLSMTSVGFEDPQLGGGELVAAGGPLTVRIGYHATDRVDDVVAVVVVHDGGGRMLFLWRSDYFGGPRGPIEAGDGEIRFRFDGIPLVEGTYPVSVGLHSIDGTTVYEWRDKRTNLNVVNSHSLNGLMYLPATVEVIESTEVHASIDPGRDRETP